MPTTTGAQWLMVFVGALLVAIIYDAAPKWGGMLVVILVFAMLGRGIARGNIEQVR